MNAPHPHRHRSIVIDETVIGVLLVGAAIIGVALWRMGYGAVVIISAVALWIVLVFFVIFAYDFVADLTGWRALQPFERWDLPSVVRRWLPLVCLVAGLMVGHFFW